MTFDQAGFLSADRRRLLGLVAAGIPRLRGLAALAPTTPRQFAARSSGGVQANGELLRVALGTVALSLDPANAVNPSGLTVIQNVYEGLVELDPAGAIQPRLAESWVASEDGRNYTFRLREATFHDGVPFDAEAVRMNVERILADPELLTHPTLAAIVGEVVPLGANEVQFQLVSPSDAFLGLLAGPLGSMASPDTVAQYSEGLTPSPVGTGPFRWDPATEGREPGDPVRLLSNSEYWDGEPQIDGLELRAGARPDVLATEFAQGESRRCWRVQWCGPSRPWQHPERDRGPTTNVPALPLGLQSNEGSVPGPAGPPGVQPCHRPRSARAGCPPRPR